MLFFIVAFGWYSSYSAENFYLKESAADLVHRANLIKAHVIDLLERDQIDELRQYTINAGRSSETRITIIANDGVVLADTNENPEVMDNHRNRPEISEAFRGTPGTSIRFSNTLGERLLYSAIPISFQLKKEENQAEVPITAVLRLSIPITAVDTALFTLRARLIAGTVAAVFVAFLVTLFVSRNISRPLEEMTQGAKHYSEGDFSKRLMLTKKTASREVAQLGIAMDEMANQLDDKINTIVNQRNELETVFSSMVEAVIAVDREEKVISLNAAAAEMFGVDRRNVHDRLIHEVIRNTEIHQQIEQVLTSGDPLEDEIAISDGSHERYLQTNTVPLSDRTGTAVGVLIVLNDVTRIRKLENVRKDFIANISHELRTPITSIRGYVETLLEGALEDKENAIKFLQTVLRQSEQLSEIIDDLLVLSRIEQNADAREMTFEMQSLRPVLEDALQVCHHKAKEKEVTVKLECDDSIQVRMNRTLFEQAIVNLVVNGITYSENGGVVSIIARSVSEEEDYNVEVRVVDHGVGIEKEHLPRLFERFYIGDKARNRKISGTGLGLSIVKHIVQAHEGTVSVSSVRGEGSEFFVRL